MSHSCPVRPLCPHFGPESSWPAGSSSLSVALLSLFFPPELFTSFPFLDIHPNTRTREVIQTHCCCCCCEELSLIRGRKKRLKEVTRDVTPNLKVRKYVRYSFKMFCMFKRGFRVDHVVRNTTKTSPSPRCAPRATHCRYSAGRRTSRKGGKEGGKDGEGGGIRHNNTV